MSNVPMGPEAPVAGPPEPAPAYGPEPVSLRPIVLVLGPGMARSFAFAGALRELAVSKVPIAAIVGTEMGGLIGALYSVDGAVNGFDWRLMKVKEDAFIKSGALSSFFKGPSDGKKLEEQLAELFGVKDLGDSKLPTWLGFENLKTGEFELVNRGTTSKLLRGAVAVPGLIQAGDWNGSTVAAVSKQKPYPVTEAKLRIGGPVVVLDVLSSRPSDALAGRSDEERKLTQRMIALESLGKSDLDSADLVIRPDMRGIGFLDFNKRTESGFRGKKAIAQNLGAIRQLVGLPPDQAELQ